MRAPPQETKAKDNAAAKHARRAVWAGLTGHPVSRVSAPGAFWRRIPSFFNLLCAFTMGSLGVGPPQPFRRAFPFAPARAESKRRKLARLLGGPSRIGLRLRAPRRGAAGYGGALGQAADRAAEVKAPAFSKRARR